MLRGGPPQRPITQWADSTDLGVFDQALQLFFGLPATPPPPPRDNALDPIFIHKDGPIHATKVAFFVRMVWFFFSLAGRVCPGSVLVCLPHFQIF